MVADNDAESPRVLALVFVVERTFVAQHFIARNNCCLVSARGESARERESGAAREPREMARNEPRTLARWRCQSDARRKRSIENQASRPPKCKTTGSLLVNANDNKPP